MASFPQLVESFISDPIFQLIGFVFTVLLAVVPLLPKNSKKLPRYDIHSQNIIDNSVNMVDRLKVLYDDHEISCLTDSRIVFWNAGGQTIERKDLPREGIRITVKGKILQPRILPSKETYKGKSAENDFSIVSHNKEVNGQSEANLFFEFLDKNQGVVIKMLHTGRSSKDVKLGGYVRGANCEPVRTYDGAIMYRTGSLERILYNFVILFFILFLAIFISSAYFSYIDNDIELFGKSILCAFIAFTVLASQHYLLKSKIPKGLDIFGG